MAGDLPEGQNYAASANRAVAEALGFPSTQAIMYSGFTPGSQVAGLTADDVNMVRMAMTGADFVAGNADDYIARLRYRAHCDGNHEIRVYIIPQQAASTCHAEIQMSLRQVDLNFHWTLVPESGAVDIQISMDQLAWDYGDRIFASGFESGDFSEWWSIGK